MGRRLRFGDLRARGIVNNRTTLNNWIRKLGFPPGQLTGPNTRTWDEETEIQRWLEGRPIGKKPTPSRPPTAGRRRRSESESDTRKPGPP
jgi:hypothetical protein